MALCLVIVIRLAVRLFMEDKTVLLEHRLGIEEPYWYTDTLRIGSLDTEDKIDYT